MPALFLLPDSWLVVIIKLRANLSSLIENKWSAEYAQTHQPLLNSQDLLTLHASAAAGVNPLSSNHEVATLLVGERSSSFAGSGYEFAENQLYVAGDDTRFINWRMLARTGKMYRKKFVEERRPELWVVIDKRASMRFGTQYRLKITEAARQAVYHLYLAQQQQLACAGVILDETVRWYKPSQDSDRLQQLIEDTIAPAPPLKKDIPHDSFSFILRQLSSRATAGSIIFLLSDFQSFPPDAPHSLYGLSKNHRVIGIHIVDPIELELPEKGKYQVVGQQNQQPELLDCDNAAIRHQYKTGAQQWQQGIKEQFIQSGASYYLCELEDE